MEDTSIKEQLTSYLLNKEETVQECDATEAKWQQQSRAHKKYKSNRQFSYKSSFKQNKQK